MKSDRLKKDRPFVRYFVFGAEILLLWLLQSTPKLLPGLFGQKPFLLLAAALSFSACCRVAPSVVLGAVCGVLADISAGGSVGFFAVSFTLVCFAQASVLGTYINQNLLSTAIVSAGSVAAVLGAYWLFFRVFAGVPDSGALFATAYLPRMLCTVIAFFPIYGLNWLVSRNTAKAERRF